MADMSSSQQVPSVVTSGLVVVSVVFPVLSLIAVLYRYKARRVARLPLQADDWWIVASWLCSFPLSINVWVFASITGINHYKINPIIGISKSLMCLLISSTILQVGLATVKISILLFYKRIFSKGSSAFGIAAWIGIILVGCWGIIFFFLVLFEGDPIKTSWTGQGVFRFDTVALGLAQSGTSIALDFVVLAYPLPVIFRLHMDRKRKIAVTLIFWLGAFCCIAAIARLALLKETLSLVSQSNKSVYNQSKQFIFMVLEPNCSIIAACLPCYGPLFAGGRAPESMVRSVRSIFSLRSRGSSGNSKKSSSKRATSKDTNGDRSGNDSLIELALDPHTEQNSNYISAQRPSHQSYEDIGWDASEGIRVTKGVDVTTIHTSTDKK